MKIEVQRHMVRDELRVTVTIHSVGAWGHSTMTDALEEIEQAADVAATQVEDVLRKIPKKIRG